MMRLLAFAVTAALLAGCDGGESTTLPDGVSAADVAVFKAAVTEAGCEITNDGSASAVEAQTGFDPQKLRIITQYLTLAGDSTPTGSGFRLTSGSCANA